MRNDIYLSSLQKHSILRIEPVREVKNPEAKSGIFTLNIIYKLEDAEKSILLTFSSYKEALKYKQNLIYEIEGKPSPFPVTPVSSKAN